MTDTVTNPWARVDELQTRLRELTARVERLERAQEQKPALVQPPPAGKGTLHLPGKDSH